MDKTDVKSTERHKVNENPDCKSEKGTSENIKQFKTPRYIL